MMHASSLARWTDIRVGGPDDGQDGWAMSASSRNTLVEAERFEGWLQRFGASHGELAWTVSPQEVVVTAADGSVAVCSVPFPPLVDDGTPLGGLAAHALIERRVGVLLVRLGGFAAGIFAGDLLLTAKASSRPVHGRSAAGGWSQHRFARRREGQTRVAYAAAADTATLILLPELTSLDAVVLGGDKAALKAVLADPRLAPLASLALEHRLDVPDPTRRLLAETPKRFRAVRITVTDPPG
jgi:Actinobacteria/chloroflexi VLRF1 release factor